MKKTGCRLAAVLIVIAVALGCRAKYPALDQTDTTPDYVHTGYTAAQGKEVIVEVIRGQGWEHTYRSGIWPAKVTPQFAIWSEDSAGAFLDTIYVTRKTAKQLWRNVPDGSADQTCILESLPRWTHLRTASGMAPPTRRLPLPDTITSATPAGSTVFYTRVTGTASEMWIMLEINQAHDGNDAFPERPDRLGRKTTGASGQPALVYGAKVDLTVPGKYEMKLLGHSSPTGGDGALSKDVSGITTAKEIVRNIYVIYQGQ